MVRKNSDIEKLEQQIGNQVYLSRIENGFSVREIANKIGVTPQQLFKYEKGIDRISSGRLVLIAKAIDKSIESFYSISDSAQEEKIHSKSQRVCIEASRNFAKIQNPVYQKAVIDLIQSLIETEKKVA